MNRHELLLRLNDIFRNELDNKAIDLNEETTAQDVEEWDSLSHIQLVVAIEKALKIRFKSSEIQSWQKVGQMIDTIEMKLK
jgi:acyl carrier protein